MSVRIVLDHHQPLYTNLDFIQGRAILSLTRNETIAAITVKLEGDSKTHLVGETPLPASVGGMGRRTHDVTIENELHKILYKLATVFPTEDLHLATASSVYTLPAGLHEFPFKFKLPFNNACADAQSTYVNVAGLQVQTPGNRDRHVRKTLPPSLSMFQDQALIRYYVKATVQRPAFYKENFRSEVTFQFFPIEPPRPPVPPQGKRSESYARIEHTFAPTTRPASSGKSPGLFRKGSVPKPDSPTTPPPQICIDARLPDPAIITCNEALPLRIMVTKLNDSPATIYLQLLQIELIARTNVRAHFLARDNKTSTVIISKSNMHIRLPENNKVMHIDKAHWKDSPLPSNVAPSFDTCNISRSYDLHVKVGLLHGLGDQTYPELVVETLVMPVLVYSGIRPPDALLQAMAGHSPPQKPPRPNVVSTASLSNLSPHPPSAGPPAADLQPPGFEALQTGQTHPEGPFPDEAPPSYEDAVADGIGPVDGPRGVYQQQQEGRGGGGVGATGESGKS
ncbi:MAG: hypothetical protein LQ338_002118 [Usnochroma carphineum]|nr:MAG: hypothetical protein LQ338_002118 [Usnochroma carphineum]